MAREYSNLRGVLLAIALAAAACIDEALSPDAATPAADSGDLARSDASAASAAHPDASASDAAFLDAPAVAMSPLDAAVRDAAFDSATDSGAQSPSSDAAGHDANLAPTFPPFVTDGKPLPGTLGTWTYTAFPDSQCRDGSPAGIFVNLGSSDKLLIFLEGGGRCADEQTCSTNPASVEDLLAQAIRSVSSAGILDRSKPENPVRDWNLVYVPYCTGDRHGGANPDANVPGVGPQKLVGHLNMKKFLNRIVPSFPNATDVLLTGISAGGFGVAYNGVLVQRAFSKVKVKLVIDSGPIVSKAVFAECDQERTRTLYRAEETFLADCGSACPHPNDYWLDFGVFLARTFRDRPSGLISSTEDAVERAFFGVGNNGCTGALDFLTPGIAAALFRDDILACREKLKPFPSFGTFYLEGDTHTLIAFDDFYTASAGGVKLIDWFSKIVNGESPGHPGP